MHFLPDVYVKCDVCEGHRYNRETLDIKYKGKNIYEVLDMTVEDSLEFFDAIPSIRKKLETLMDVNRLRKIRSISYNTEEAQRSLQRALQKFLEPYLYILMSLPLDSYARCPATINSTKKLRDNGNTVVVIEHNKTQVVMTM